MDMQFHLEITETEAVDLFEFYSSKMKLNFERIKELHENNNIIEERMRTIRKWLDDTGSNLHGHTFTSESIPFPDGYSDKLVWFDKVKYILQQAQKGLTTSEIIEDLIKLEPKYKKDRQTAVRSISATVSAKAKEGKIGRVENERKEFVYFINMPALENEVKRGDDQLEVVKSDGDFDDIF